MTVKPTSDMSQNRNRDAADDSIARQIGIRAILMKPVVKKELAGAVRRILDGTGPEGDIRV